MILKATDLQEIMKLPEAEQERYIGMRIAEYLHELTELTEDPITKYELLIAAKLISKGITK